MLSGDLVKLHSPGPQVLPQRCASLYWQAPGGRGLGWRSRVRIAIETLQAPQDW